MKTMTMTTGEVDFNSILRLFPEGGNDGTVMEVPYLEVSYLLWIIFIIIMPILLSNLLVSYVIEDKL